MVSDFKITGNLVNAYMVCHRKLWLYAHQLNPDPEMDLLALGRLINEESYKREKKEIEFDNLKIDLVAKDSDQVVICEVKKSSKELEAAKMQLLFYMDRLRYKGLKLSGEVRIPKERKKIAVEWNEEAKRKLDEILQDVEAICKAETPPPPVRRGLCKHCAFFEFCFAG